MSIILKIINIQYYKMQQLLLIKIRCFYTFFKVKLTLSCTHIHCYVLQNLHQEIELYDARVQALLESGQTLVEKCSPTTSASLRRSLENLSVRWENIKTRSSERKTKLEDALKQADSFHESLNSIIVWLTNAEKTLNNVKPVSRVVESCLAQIEQHKVGCRYVLFNSLIFILWLAHHSMLATCL